MMLHIAGQKVEINETATEVYVLLDDISRDNVKDLFRTAAAKNKVTIQTIVDTMQERKHIVPIMMGIASITAQVEMSIMKERGYKPS